MEKAPGTKPMRVGSQAFRAEPSPTLPFDLRRPLYRSPLYPTGPATCFMTSALRGASFLAGQSGERPYTSRALSDLAMILRAANDNTPQLQRRISALCRVWAGLTRLAAYVSRMRARDRGHGSIRSASP